MNKNIIHKINALGGNTDAVNISENFAEKWKNIRFNNHLYHKDWQLYGIDEFHETHKELYGRDKQKFFEHLLGHYFSDHDEAYGQYFYKNWYFTPFKENSDDYEELDDLVEENELREVVEGAEMEFICIFYSYGYPDHFFVCTTDPDQSNPTVYSTDHEVYFQEIESKGKREDFLDGFMTKEEFSETVITYLEEKSKE